MKKIFIFLGILSSILFQYSCSNLNQNLNTLPKTSLQNKEFVHLLLDRNCLVDLGLNDKGNSFPEDPAKADKLEKKLQQDDETLGEEGIHNWTNPNAKFSVWFKPEAGVSAKLYLKTRVQSGSATLKVSAFGKSFNVEVSNTDWQLIPIGDTINLPEVISKYVHVDLEAVNKTGQTFPDVSELVLGGDIINHPIIYAQAGDIGSHGKQGPNIHFGYDFPKGKTIEYFYSEVTVPKGNDIVGTYYMANGFTGGYFGFQRNELDRNNDQILFSVWNLGTTEPSDTLTCIDHGIWGPNDEVKINHFGGEGSGGKALGHYAWIPGNTYKFVTAIHPSNSDPVDKRGSVYTSYFYVPELKQWRLLACWYRPYDQKNPEIWYSGAYSFLEDFNAMHGGITRKCYFGNQYCAGTDKKWIPINSAYLTLDQTGWDHQRADYKCGVDDLGRFYLQNCGFFNDMSKDGEVVNRKASQSHTPTVDLSALFDKYEKY